MLGGNKVPFSSWLIKWIETQDFPGRPVDVTLGFHLVGHGVGGVCNFLSSVSPQQKFEGKCFSFSNYLTFFPQEMEGPILREQGYQGPSGYFLLSWDGEGLWASPSR